MTDKPASFDWGVSIVLSDDRQENGQRCGQITICDQVGEIVNWRMGADKGHILFEIRALRNSWMDDFVRGKLRA